MALQIGFNQAIAVRHFPVTLRRLPPDLSGLRILHFSDPHLNGNPRQQARLLSLLASLPADLIAFTGDILFGYDSPPERALSFFEKLRKLAHPRLGLHLVRGNHDGPEVVAMLQHAGFNLILNGHLLMDQSASPWYLISVDDPRRTRRAHRWRSDKLPEAMAGIPDHAFKILLAHSPEIINDAARLDVDLVLAGHTHGGQIRLPWVGALVTRTTVPRRYAWGLNSSGDTFCHATSGAGSSFPPIRLNCPQEVAILELLPCLR